MRGTVNWQINTIFKESGIFRPGESKHEAKESAREALAQQGESATSSNVASRTGIYSYRTAEVYKDTWHSLGQFCKDNFGLKDMSRISNEHVQAYLEYKVEQGVSYKTFQRECAAIRKFEVALQSFHDKYAGIKYQLEQRNINFSETIGAVRETAKEVLNRELCERGYVDAKEVITNIKSESAQLAASVQYEGGARLSEATWIKENQLKGYVVDKISGEEKGVIHLDNTKGGKERDIMVSKETYSNLKAYINQHGEFRISKSSYAKQVADAAQRCGEQVKDTHSFRYNFAQSRYNQYLEAGYTHEQSLQGVSWEMGHERADISLHYLR
jgi:site-specific recombinase XerD